MTPPISDAATAVVAVTAALAVARTTSMVRDLPVPAAPHSTSDVGCS